MIIGQTLMKASVPYYSAWFPREGNAATFVLDCLGISGASLTVNVMHKNYGDIDYPVDQVAGAFSAVSATGTSTRRLTGLKELIRFEYNVVGSNSYDWVHFRMLRPAWEANASASAVATAGIA